MRDQDIHDYLIIFINLLNELLLFYMISKLLPI